MLDAAALEKHVQWMYHICCDDAVADFLAVQVVCVLQQHTALLTGSPGSHGHAEYAGRWPSGYEAGALSLALEY